MINSTNAGKHLAEQTSHESIQQVRDKSELHQLDKGRLRKIHSYSRTQW